MSPRIRPLVSLATLLLLLPTVSACAPQDEGAVGSAFAAAATRYDPPPADTAPTVTRRVWADSAGWEAVLVAPTLDGRQIVLTDWRTGDLGVLTLGSGEFRHLTHNMAPYFPGFGMIPRMSRDGSRVAFGWWDAAQPDAWQLRTIALEGGEPQVVHASPTTYYMQAEDWSPDGRTLLSIRAREEGNEIVVSAADASSERVLKQLDWRMPSRVGFSPDGRWIAYDLNPAEDRPERDVYLLSVDGTREVHLIDHPADDAFLGWSPDGGGVLVASDRTGTPGAWLFPVADGRLQGAPLLVKPDLWQAVGVGFTPAGSFYYGIGTGSRTVKYVELDATTGRPTGAPVQASSRSMSTSSSPAWSPEGRHIAYLSQAEPMMGNGVPPVITVRSLESGEIRQFSLPARFLQLADLRWHADGQSILFRAGERRLLAGVFRLDLQTGEVSSFFAADGKRLQDHDVSRDGRTLVYMTQEPAGPEVERILVVRDLGTGEERELYRLRGPFNQLQLRRPTLSHDGRTVAFVHWRPDGTEDLFTIPLAGGEPRKVTSMRSIHALAFDPDDLHILLTVTAGGEEDLGSRANRGLYRVPVAGGDPEALGIELRQFDGLQVHPGSRRLAFTAGAQETELWVMEGFLPQRPPAR